MNSAIYVFDPTQSDTLSKVRGIGRYLQIFKENFPRWAFTNNLPPTPYTLHPTFINPFFNLLQPPLVMRRIAKKQVAIIHDLIPLKYPAHFPIGIRGKINVFLNRLSLKNYDRIITDSEASKKDIVKILGINEQKIKVVYPCLPKIFINPKLKKTTPYPLHPTPFCLYVGDATWNKNLVNLAKAIKIMNITCIFVGKVFKQVTGGTGGRDPDDAQRSEHRREGNPGQNLLRAGNIWQQELYDFLHETKDDKRFIFAGFVPDEELIKLYQQARCNILSSRDEGFGFSYLEAASQKCPTVLADIPILHEISNDQALFTNPNNPHEIANAIGEIYFHNDLRTILGEKAYKRSQQFSAVQFKKQFLKAIQ